MKDSLANLKKPDIVDLISKYADLRPRGKDFWTCCPLPGHEEKTPSFKISTDQQRFSCYGCHRHGDAIEFIRIMHDLDFAAALRHLGIDGGRPDRRTVERAMRKRDLLAEFRSWERRYHSELCAKYRGLQKAKEQVETEADVENLADLYHAESRWVHHLEIMENGDDQARFELYQAVQNG